MGLVCINWPKSKLVLLIVTMKLDKSLNQIPQGGLEKIGYTSSNGPPGNCCKIQDKYLIGHVLRGQNGGSTVTSFIRRIAKQSHRIQNHLANIELLAREYNMNKLSRRSLNLSTMGGKVKGIDEKGSK